MKLVRCLLIGALAAAPALAASQGPKLSVPYTLDSLPNGLTVIVHEDHAVPIVTVNIWYHVGSSDEKPGRTGFAHLFEHLMFMGSQHAEYPTFDRLLEAAGAQNNASTNNDVTDYYESGPSSALPLMLWLDADRMGWLLPTMDKPKVDLQRDVVKNERRQSVENRPYGLVEDHLPQLTYPAGHPYSWSVIGSMADLSAASVEDVKDFFRRYYAPNNATLVVAGDVKAADVRAMAKKYFSEIPRGPAITRPAPAPFAVHDTAVTLQDRVQLPQLQLTWHTVREWHGDDAALDIAASVLAGSRTSRLTQALVYNTPVATNVRAREGSMHLDGDFSVIATARRGFGLDTLRTVIDAEIRKLASEGPTARELEQAKNGIEAQFLRRIQTMRGTADQLNRYFYVTGKPRLVPGRSRPLPRRHGRGRTARRQAVPRDQPRDDLRRADRQAGTRRQEGGRPMNRNYVTSLATAAAFVLAPAAAAAQGTTGALDRSHPPALGANTSFHLPAVARATLPNGVAIQVIEHRALPLVHVLLIIDGGSRLEGRTPGLASFTARMLTEGAGTRDANALQSDIGFIGAQLTAGASEEAFVIQLDVAKRSLGQALDLLADVALRPAFRAANVNQQRDLRLQSLLQRRDQPTQLAVLAFNQLVFPVGHPDHDPADGDSASTASLDSVRVRDFYNGAFTPARAHFVVVGDVTEPEMRALLVSRFGAWKAASTPRAIPKVTVKPVTNDGVKVYLVDKPGAAQSVIELGGPGADRLSPDYAAITVMNTILGASFSSRLNTNLRETKGYTYGISSRFGWSALPGPFVVASQVRTNVTDSSLVEIFKELRAIRDAPVEAKELDRAKAYVALAVPGRFETNASIAGQLADLDSYRLPLSSVNEFVARVNSVTAADVQRVARQYIPADRATLVVVGDLAKVRTGIEALRLGTVTTLDISSIAR